MCRVKLSILLILQTRFLLNILKAETRRVAIMFLRVGILELNSNLSLTGFKSEDISKFVAQKMRGH